MEGECISATDDESFTYNARVSRLPPVQEGETGAFYHQSDPAALADVIAAFDPMAVDPAACVDAAQRFGTERFQASLRAIVEETVAAESTGDRDRPAVVPGLLPRRARRAAAGR